MDFVSEYFRALFGFELRAWIPTILSFIFFGILFWRQSQKKYIITLDSGAKFSAKEVWENFSSFMIYAEPDTRINGLVVMYRKLLEAKYDTEYKLNTKISNHISEIIKLNNINSVFYIHQLYFSLQENEKVNDNYLYKKMCFLLNTYDDRLLIADLDINPELYDYAYLLSFSKSIKALEESGNDNFINFIKLYSPSIYKKIHTIQDYVNDENDLDRYLRLEKELLSFTKISDLPKSLNTFYVSVDKSCSSDLPKTFQDDLKRDISRRLLMLVDKADTLSSFEGLKNMKELFDILSQYVIPQDLVDVYTDIKRDN